ncbi:hypothetical protein [Methyloceanibacter superfactus]|uniref:hypothetical protein n=1 Tax=Methyloceanibacter superfactus TaxID=1774969 RepID=UPI00114CBE5B|nr:hypothetical protein [Methyloceanibacter superfactus]
MDDQPAISLPANAGVPLAEDLAAAVLLVHFSRSLESLADLTHEALLAQLGAYLDEVDINAGHAAGAPKPMTLPEIALVVLSQLGLRAKRKRQTDRLERICAEIRDCLKKFGLDGAQFKPSLAATLKKIGALREPRAHRLWRR